MAWATGHISPPHAATSAAEFSCCGVSRPRTSPASLRESLCFEDQGKAAGST